MAKIVSISMTEQEKEWLDDMEISPTALMKQKISEMMTSSLSQRKRIKDLEENIEKLVLRIEKMYQFMETKSILSEWESFQGQN